jgi:hypothetical protein
MHHPAGFISCTKWRNQNAQHDQRGSTTAQFEQNVLLPILPLPMHLRVDRFSSNTSDFIGVYKDAASSSQKAKKLAQAQLIHRPAMSWPFLRAATCLMYSGIIMSSNSTRLNVISSANAISMGKYTDGLEWTSISLRLMIYFCIEVGRLTCRGSISSSGWPTSSKIYFCYRGPDLRFAPLSKR